LLIRIDLLVGLCARSSRSGTELLKSSWVRVTTLLRSTCGPSAASSPRWCLVNRSSPETRRSTRSLGSSGSSFPPRSFQLSSFGRPHYALFVRRSPTDDDLSHPSSVLSVWPTFAVFSERPTTTSGPASSPSQTTRPLSLNGTRKTSRTLVRVSTKPASTSSSRRSSTTRADESPVKQSSPTRRQLRPFGPLRLDCPRLCWQVLTCFWVSCRRRLQPSVPSSTRTLPTDPKPKSPPRRAFPLPNLPRQQHQSFYVPSFHPHSNRSIRTRTQSTTTHPSHCKTFSAFPFTFFSRRMISQFFTLHDLFPLSQPYTMSPLSSLHLTLIRICLEPRV
jgi:hypothetical protein